MRRITALLGVLSIWFLSLPSLQTIDMDIATPTPSVHYEQILQIPAINENTPVSWAAWNPVASNFAAVYQNEKTINILDGRTGSIIQQINIPEPEGNSYYAWSPNGRHIAALLGNPNNVIKIWPLTEKSHEMPILFNHLGRGPYPLFWSPDSLKLATTGYVSTSMDDGATVLSIWDAQNGKLISQHQHMTIGSWSPDGKKMMVLAGEEHITSLQIVDAESFQTLLTFSAKIEPDNLIGYALWMPNSQQVIVPSCNSSACTLWLWDIQTGQITKHFEHQGIIVLVEPGMFAVNTSGRLLAATFFNIVYLWDIQSGKLLSPLTIKGEIRSLSWNYGQDMLVLASENGTIEVWKVKYSN